MQLVKTVFHVHTDHSDDCNLPVETLIESARRLGVGCITITDHDTISGARAMAAAAGPGLKVIVGEEVSTTGGHLIGLFLHEEIEPGLSPRQTALEIKRQGGLVVIPHPFNWMFGCGLCGRLAEVIDLADAVEVCNAQNFWSVPNLRAERFARVHKFPAVVGVDIHHGDDLDACYQMMPAFHGPSQFLTSLRQAALVRGRHRPSYFIKTAWHVFLDRSGLGMPAGFGARATRRRRPAKPGPVAAMVPVKRG